MENKIKRIRMLKSLATAHSWFEQGRVYRIPEDLPEYMALSWISTGVAEEEKSIDRVPETKTVKKAKEKKG